MADLGYFGPDSVSWRVHREVTVLFGGARAVLMQAAHPLVIAGARETGFYERNPWKRLQRTLVLTYTITFGSKAEADAAAERINDVHARVKGIDAETGLPYDGLDPDLLLYVHACLIESAVVSRALPAGGAPPPPARVRACLPDRGRARFRAPRGGRARRGGSPAVPRGADARGRDGGDPAGGDPADRPRAPHLPADRVRLGHPAGRRGRATGGRAVPRSAERGRMATGADRCVEARVRHAAAGAPPPVRDRGGPRPAGGDARGVRRDPGPSTVPAAALALHRAVPGVAHGEVGTRA